MHEYYWFGVDLGSFLFPGYNVTTLWSFLATCLGLIALAILYEAMKISQIYLQQIVINTVPRTASTSSEDSSLLSKVTPKLRIPFCTQCGSCTKWTLQVLHWSLHTTLGYILMMAVMTYNAYITIALVIGVCFGYWIFGSQLVQLNMQRFYNKRAIVECDKNCGGAFLFLATSKCIMIIINNHSTEKVQSILDILCYCTIVIGIISLLTLFTDVFVNQQRRESAVSIVAEELITEATVEIHSPTNT